MMFLLYIYSYHPECLVMAADKNHAKIDDIYILLLLLLFSLFIHILIKKLMIVDLAVLRSVHI